MNESPFPDVDRLLELASQGDAAATEALVATLYDELRSMARMQLRRQRPDHTLQTTALVNEAWLRLAGDKLGRAEDRNAFLRHAARAMRSILIDHARRRGAQKRLGGSGQVLAIDEDLATWQERDLDLLELDSCLKRLEVRDPELTRVVELRFFAGLSEEETGEVLGLTRRQVQHAWKLARAWLHRELGGDRSAAGG